MLAARCLSPAICLVSVLLLAAPRIASAAPVVNVDTAMPAILQLTTGGTASLTLSLTNAGDAFQEVNSYTLAVVLVPSSGTGTLTLASWTKPATDGLLTDLNAEFTPTDAPVTQTLNAPVSIGGTDYYDFYSLQAANTNGFNDRLNAAATKNVGVLTFSAGLTTSGTWDIYVVNQEAQPGGLPVSLTQTADGTASGFGNLPPVNGASVKVATVAVAVPEPASLAFAGVIVVAAAARTVRRRS